MFQFGEVLALVIGAIAMAFVLTNWRRIRNHPALAPFVWPFLLLTYGWIATVVEGFFLEGEGIPLLIFGRESQYDQFATVWSQRFHLIEHFAYAAAAVWLLVLVVSALKKPQERAA